jgi:hypothetical protein
MVEVGQGMKRGEGSDLGEGGPKGKGSGACKRQKKEGTPSGKKHLVTRRSHLVEVLGLSEVS